MEPANKKARLLTDHFRVALKPRDLNAFQVKRKEIPLVTIDDDEINNGPTVNIKQHQHSQQQVAELKSIVSTSKQQPPLLLLPPPPPPPPPSSILSVSIENRHPPQLQQQHNSHQKQNLKRPLAGPLVSLVVNNNLNANNNNQIACTSSSFNINNYKSGTSLVKRQKQLELIKTSTSKLEISSPLVHNEYLAPHGKHPSILDYDKSLLNNVNWEPHYAYDSFVYDREQEILFKTTKYLIEDEDGDSDLENEMVMQRRSELVDWSVEIQMRFCLDHEPLYMAIKLADQYLMRKPLQGDDYLLLFTTCILIASKFDERVPPITVADLIQLARSKFSIRYCRKQIISLEVDLLKTLNFNIRFPLSYGFLRRFARCTRSDMKTLHLARYILESSLMEYDMIDVLESKIAAGSLLLAFEMLRQNGAWDETAKFYTGYDEQELTPLMIRLNDTILKFSRRRTAIRRKYSHESFMEVAKIAPVLPESLANR